MVALKTRGKLSSAVFLGMNFGMSSTKIMADANRRANLVACLSAHCLNFVLRTTSRKTQYQVQNSINLLQISAICDANILFFLFFLLQLCPGQISARLLG